MTVAQRIIALLQEKRELSVKEMVDLTDVSKQAIHTAINSLLENKQIIRLGKVPKTIYKLAIAQDSEERIIQIDSQDDKFLKEHFLAISELGELMPGIQGFSHWCKQRKLPVEKTISEFIKTKERYNNNYYNSIGIIDGKEKLTNTKGFDKLYLDEIYYLAFYAIERFGKTRLGTLLHYAKQGQNKYLMKMLLGDMKPKLDVLLNSMSFDAVGFVPPTIKREVQIMKYLETHLKINLPKVHIQKISGIIAIPQKSLSKLEERIRNADHTFAVNDSIHYNNVLLIDDAVGSGATLNQIAAKLKQKNIAQKITGLAVVGSFKGFDVITDV